MTDHSDREYVRDLVLGLAEVRKKLNLSVVDVALRAHWSPTTVRRFESGALDPKMSQVMTYVRATGGRVAFEIAPKEEEK